MPEGIAMPDEQKDSTELWQALFAIQTEVEGIVKKGENPHFKSSYAERSDILAILKPLLQKNGLLLVQAPVPSPQAATPDMDYLALSTSIVHVKSGQMITSTAVTPLQKSDPQGYGSAITYLSRYSIVSLFVLPLLEDDDGNAASGPRPNRATAGTSKPAKATAGKAASGTASKETKQDTETSQAESTQPTTTASTAEKAETTAKQESKETSPSKAAKPGRKLWGK